jgi:VCBS repeat-containing protein
MLSSSLSFINFTATATATVQTTVKTQQHHISTVVSYPQHLVIIDSQVEDYHRLVHGVIPGSLIIVVDNNTDGIEQITETLKAPYHFNTLHIVSHGYPGGLILGNSQLSLNTLNKYSDQIQQWNIPTILLYGCQVAAGDAGNELIEKLHDLTDANIAASATKTGNTALGGDWNLEVTRGELETALAFQPKILQSYQGIFAVSLDLNGTDSGNDYSATYTEEGSTVTIADTDATLTSTATNIQSTTIVLTNAQDGDILIVGTLKSGIKSNIDTSVAGEITVTLTGPASAANFQDALQNGVGFVNLLNNPNTTTTRNIDITVTDTGGSSNTATTTIDVEAVNDAPVVDLDGDDSSTFAGGTTEAEKITGTITDGSGSGTFTLERTAFNGFTDTVDFLPGAKGIEALNNFKNDEKNDTSNPDQFTYNFSVTPDTNSSISEVQVFQAPYAPPSGTTEPAEYIFTWTGGGQAVLNDPDNQFSSHADGALISSDDVLTFRISTPHSENTWRLDIPATEVTVAMTSTNTQNPADQAFNEWISFDAVFHPEPDYLTSFTEGGSPVAIADTDATITDIDGSNIESATIVLTNALTDDDLILDETALSAGISLASKDTSVAGQITITLTGNASLSDYQSAIQLIQFNNTSNGLNTTDRIIEVTVSDGEATSPTATTTITIAAVNDPPSFTNLDNNPSYVLGDDAVVLDSDATISDLELDAANNYNGATLTLERNVSANAEDVFGIDGGTLTEGGDLTVDGIVIGTVTTNNNGTLVFTFNSDATGDLVDQALQKITYSNTGNTTDSVTINYTINDKNTGEQGTGDEKIGTGSITVTLVENNVPSSSDHSITTDEDKNHTFSSSDFLFSDDDSGDRLQSVKITALPTNGKLLLDGVEITTINTEVSLSDIEDKKLQFEPNNNENGNDYANFTFQVSDGRDYSSDSTLTIDVDPINDSPSFSSLDNNPSYTLGENAVVLDSNATIIDPELDADNNYNGATLTLQRKEIANAEDVFGISGGTLTEGGDLTVNGTVIGTVTTNSNGTLVLTFNSSATADLVDQALQKITYSNTGSTTGLVTIDYTINDGNTGAQGTGGALTRTGSITVNLTDTTANNDPVANDSSITVNEGSVDTPLGLTSPTDDDGDNLTIKITEIPKLGTVTKADETPISVGDILTKTELTGLIYDAPTDSDGTTNPGNFVYEVTDGNGGKDTGTVDITINALPVAENDSVGTTKDTAITIDVLADNGNGEDSDPDNDELTITQVNGRDINPGDIITLPSGALLTLNTDGTFSYDPNGQFNSLTGTATDTDSFTYVISDGTETSEATVTITIAGENSPPMAENDAVSTDANTVLTGNVLTDNGNGEDRDPDNNEITVNRINNETVNMGQPILLDSGAEITLNSDGTFSYNPNGQFASLGAGETATDTFTYTINDGIADSEPATVTITINGVNDAPVATEDNLKTSPQRPLTFDPLTNDTDPDGDDLILESIDTQPSNGQIVQNPDGTLTYIPNPNFTGSDSFTYTINDGNGGTATTTVTIDVNPDADGDGILDADDLDDDNDAIPDSEEGTGDTDGDGVPDRFDLDSDNDGISDLNESGLSPETIAELDTDNDGVIDTPVGDNGLADAVETTPESGELDLDGDGQPDDQLDTDSDNIPDFRDLDSDNDGILDVTEVGNPDTDNNGLVDGEDGDGDGLIDTVDPSSDNPLTVPLDSDGDGVADHQDLDSDNDGIHDIIEGGLEDADGDGIVSGSDNDGDGIADSIDNNDGFGNTNQPSPLDSDGDGTPDYLDLDSDNDGINDIEEVGLADPDGDGRLDSNDVDGDGIADAVDQNNDGFGDIEAVDLPDSDGDGIPDFRDVNNSPIATDDNANIAANQSITLDVLNNDSDADGDPLSIDSFAPTSANGGTITLDGDNFIYAPADGFTGSDTFTYKISDGNGGISTATITITVENGIPVANNDTETTPTNTPVTINALDNDTDSDGHPLSIDRFDPNSANGGTITLDGNNLIYTPADGFTGSDTFTYTISDGNGGISTATITITVENGIPVANNDTETTPTNTPVTINALDNDTDSDGHPLSIDRFDSTSTNGGTITLDGDNLIYTPADGFTGSDTFTYTISDGNGGISTATITITVENGVPVDNSNNIPVATDDNINTPVNTPITVDILENDSDADGDRITIDSFDSVSSSGGIVSLDQNQLVYTPPADFSGIDTFTYTISDGNGGSDTAIVTVTVDNPPVATPPVTVEDNCCGCPEVPTINAISLPTQPPIEALMFPEMGNSNNATILGSDNNDNLTATSEDDFVDVLAGDDEIVLLDGNDTLIAGDGDDLAYAGFGNDLLFGNNGNDFLKGDSGNDTIIGSPSGDQPIGNMGEQDHLFGDDGDDWLGGNLGNDTLHGGVGGDRIHGGKDNDHMLGEIGNDTLWGEQGDDVLLGGTSNVTVEDVNGRDLLFGGDGNDTLYGNQNLDTLVAGDGDDQLHGGQGDDLLYGNTGDDVFFGEFGNDTIIGGPSGDQPLGDTGDRDLIFGDAGDDWIAGNLGRDTLHAGTGNDRVHGGKDNDWLLGELGDDTLNGEQGDDTILGGTSNDPNDPTRDIDGKDLLFGEAGNDFLDGNEGNDTLVAGEGNDTAYGGKDNDLIFGNAGNDRLLGDEGNDTLCGGEGDDTLRGDQMDDGNSPAVGSNGQQDMLSGGQGNDLLYGDEGQDTLCGGQGNDTLHGGKDNDVVKGCLGDDLLLGELGDDTLMGGEGNDTLTGGEGIDTFVINPNHGNNLITDFQLGQDQLMLADINFNQLQITQDGNSTLISFNNQVLATLDQVNAIDLDLNQFI